MVKRSLSWLKRHPWWVVSVFVVMTFAITNGVAYMQAFAMTHFTTGTSAPGKPETLSVLQKARLIFTGVRISKPADSATPEKMGLPFTVQALKTRDGATLEAWHISHSYPKGLVLVFHGYASCKAKMLAEANAFHELGYAVLLVDFRGSGGSSEHETTIGVTEATDVTTAYEYAQATWPGQPLILFGTSMGSVAILRAIHFDRLQPEGIVVECPFDRLLTTVKHRFSAMRIPAFPCAHPLVFWGGFQSGFDGFAHNPIDFAETVHCPVLQLHGEKDPRVHLEEAKAIFANLGTEQKWFEPLPGVGHESYVHARPDAWRRLVDQFLGRLGLPGRNP